MELIAGAVRTNGHDLITEAEAKLTQEDIQTIKNAIFKGAEESELKLFLHDCQRCGVHPLDRLIHPTIRTNKDGSRTYTAITSIDLFRSRAEDTGFYAGNDDPVFSGQPKTDSFEAKVTVWKIVQGQRVPFTATARWTEYKPKDGMDFMWQKMPHQMLGKCAEALALRKAFPRQLGKLYVKEEMEQADAPPAQEQPKPEAPKGPRKYKLNPVQPPVEGDDADKVPASVTDAAAPIGAPTPAPDQGEEGGPDESVELVTLEACTKERDDKKGQRNRGLKLVCADGSSDWWQCYEQESMDLAAKGKGQKFYAKLEDKNGFKLCHNLTGVGQ